MLALRARGLGSAWTTAHLKYAKEAVVGSVLHPAKRVAAKERTYWDTWGQRG